MNAAAELIRAADVSVRVVDAPATGPTDDHEVERLWQRLCAENPKLFDAGIYSVQWVDAARGRLEVSVDRYKRLVVQPEVKTGVHQLSVSALAIAPGGEGRPCVLLGRRGRRTRMYGGMWQICPAGGVEPPQNAAAPREFALPELETQLERELEEETGLRPGWGSARPLAIVHDPVAHSYDIVLRADFDRPCPPRPRQDARWEHEEIRWVPLADLPEFCRTEPVIDATRALLGAVGFITP